MPSDGRGSVRGALLAATSPPAGAAHAMTPTRTAALVIAVSLVSAALASLASGTTPVPKLLGGAPNADSTWQVRPAQIVYTGDGSGVLGGFDGTGAAHPGRLTWITWSQTKATGSGAVWIDNCTPNCASGKFTARAVRVVAFRDVRSRFTRLTLTYSYHGKRVIDRRGIRRFGGTWAYFIVAR